ncbi:hypothetical protein Dimus_038864 [Dionaea muscipula]
MISFGLPKELCLVLPLLGLLPLFLLRLLQCCILSLQDFIFLLRFLDIISHGRDSSIPLFHSLGGSLCSYLLLFEVVVSFNKVLLHGSHLPLLELQSSLCFFLLLLGIQRPLKCMRYSLLQRFLQGVGRSNKAFQIFFLFFPPLHCLGL